MNILDRITNLIQRHYKPVWESCDRDEAFKLCNQIRQQTGVPEYLPAKFDEGWQYRTIFHQDYKVAKEESLNLVFGWW